MSEEAGFKEIMNRPLRCMGAEDHERMLRDNLLKRHEQWCKELRDVTLDVLTGPERVAALRNFDFVAETKACDWFKAKVKLEEYGQIHAWAVSGRRGHPGHYQVEGNQIAESFIDGVPWTAWSPWRGGWSECSECRIQFKNPYWHKKHTCVRSDDVESRLSE